MSSTSALLVRIYPNNKQESLLNKGFLFRFYYYKALAMWWNITYDTCCKLYHSFCEKEQDAEKQKEYSKTLPWPSKKLTKEGLNDTCLKVVYDQVPKFMKFACVKDFTDIVKNGKDKGEVKNYGDVFKLNSVYLPTKYGVNFVSSGVSSWCKENFARAVKMTFEKGKKNTRVRYPNIKEANTFKISIKCLQTKKKANGKVNKIYIPFLSGVKRKQLGSSIEWFDCSLSDSQLLKVTDATNMTITKNSAGQYYVSVGVTIDGKDHQETGCECGIDLGIKTTATLAINMVGETSSKQDKFTKYDLPVEKIKMLEEKIEFLQSIQMRRIKTWVRLHKEDEAKNLKMNTDKNDRSHNAVIVYNKKYKSRAYINTEKRIAKLNKDIANIRKNFSEQFSRHIADNYDVVGLEDLNVKGMVKNHKLARSINRIGFYKLRSAIERKVKKGNVIYIDRFAPSSQVCSICGYKNSKVKNLSIREWDCPYCGHHHNRDENAASNIRPSVQTLCLKEIKGNNKI